MFVAKISNFISKSKSVPFDVMEVTCSEERHKNRTQKGKGPSVGLKASLVM